MARTHAKTHQSKPIQPPPEMPKHNVILPQRSEQPQQQAGQSQQRIEQRQPPTHEQIAQRAYELYLSRGGDHGRHEEDWMQAERDLGLGR